MTSSPFRGLIKSLTQAFDWICWIAFCFSGICLFLLVFLTVEQVIARYFFQASSVALQELEWHLFGAAIMLSLAHTLKIEGHVRVDFLYGKFSSSVKNAINSLGLFLLIPTCFYLSLFCFEFALDSYQVDTVAPSPYLPWVIRGESSPDPGGLPARWLLQVTIPIGLVLLALQAT
ncbi:MAG: TRAP transporter small permease subunit, partial [Bdellovibrionales bacterium]|nr:TRAP transporter small permease subunit [Bdellovibrionales bacterium]